MKKDKITFGNILFTLILARIILVIPIYLLTRWIMIVRGGEHWILGFLGVDPISFHPRYRNSIAPPMLNIVYLIGGIYLGIGALLMPYRDTRMTDRQVRICFFMDLLLIMMGILIITFFDIDALKNYFELI